MRWFKHMTASGNDEKLSRLKDKFGLEGYGFWWAVLEIVAEKVGEDAQTSAEFSLKKWGSLVGVSPKKFRTLAEFCANIELFSIKFDQDLLCIDMPNILKYRDEYTERLHKKSGQNRDKLGPSRARGTDTEAEADTEVKKKREKEKAHAHSKSTPKVQPEKLKFGENGNVLLSQEEHDSLCRKFTPELTQKAIAFLDLHIGAKGKDEYKSHNLAMQKWVFDAVQEREAKQARASPALLGTGTPRPTTYHQQERENQKSVARIALMGLGVNINGEQTDYNGAGVIDADVVRQASG